MTVDDARTLANNKFDEMNKTGMVMKNFPDCSVDTVKTLFRIAFLHGVSFEMDHNIKENLETLRQAGIIK